VKVDLVLDQCTAREFAGAYKDCGRACPSLLSGLVTVNNFQPTSEDHAVQAF
jgi:hypothetical protein